MDDGADWRLAAPVRGIALFAVGYALVDLLPVLLPASPAWRGLRWNDLADATLVFLLVWLYVRLALDAELWRARALRVAVAAGLLLLVQGHAVHLAANAIAAGSAPSERGWDLIYFLDEHWGHTELHLAFVVLAALFIGWGQSSRAPAWSGVLSGAERAGLVVATAAYGLLLAGDAIEGQTVPLILPAGVSLFLWGFWPGRGRGGVHRFFFAASFGVAAAALAGYGLVMGGFPELSP